MLNTPHNPTGKVFSRAEIARIGELCARHDSVVVTDEVYEHLVYAPARLVRPATVDGLADRTITISSGGKTFSLTGWKVGWVIAAPELRATVQRAHEHVVFATSSALQDAIAQGLRLPDAFFEGLRSSYVTKRDLLTGALARRGLTPHASEGTFFVMADSSILGLPDDFAAARHLTVEVGVAAIPPSHFYREADRALARHLLRFAYCKTDEVLAEAVRRLAP
jgi:N-succinyldiaminopimelate aminotransferase